jgi:outer membrane protein assembly factor BamB
MRRVFSWVLVLGSLGLGGAAAVVGPPGARGEDWPQWLGEDREGVWRETGLLERFPAGRPKVRWRARLGPGNSGPAVAGGRVYVMDRQPALGADGKPLPTKDGKSLGKERVVCLRADNGKPVWERAYDCPYRIAYPSGPRVTPLVHKGRVYTLGAMGDLYCLDAATGAARWHKDLASAYKAPIPVWGWAASPLVDGNLLYCLVGGKGSAVVAFNKETGKEVWKALTTEEVGYSPPILIRAGGKRQLIVWHSDSVNGLDPATGRVYWTQPYPTEGEPERPAPTVSQVRKSGDLLFGTSYYHGPLMLKPAADRPGVTVLWKDKTKKRSRPIGLHCLMSTPVIKGGYIYGVCRNGELRCCDVKTGDQRWETYAPVAGKKIDCATAFLVPQGDRFFLFNDSGELILANLTAKGYAEIDRARIVEPVEAFRDRKVVWAHPAFANRCVYARNNKEMVCVSLAASDAKDEGQRPAPKPKPPGRVAFMRKGRVWVIAADGSGERALTETLPYTADRPVAWMPDGRRILYWKHSKVGWDVWAVTPDGKEPTNLTRVEKGGCRSAAPSPDGKRIAFLRDNPPALYLMDADGGNQRRLTEQGFRDFLPTWSPDGKRLAYSVEGERGKFSLCCYDLATGKDVRVGPGRSPRWSPDGKRLLFEDVRDRVAMIGLVSPEGGDEVRLTKGPGHAVAPAWSPTGDRIAYFAPREGKAELWVLRVEGKKSRLVASVEGPWESAPSWSPDGKRLTFAAGPSAKRVVYVVDDQGRGLRKLATGGACYPVWQPGRKGGA